MRGKSRTGHIRQREYPLLRCASILWRDELRRRLKLIKTFWRMFGDVRKAMRGETDREGRNFDKQFKKFLSLTLGGVSMHLAVFLMEAVIT